jgi:hypothetical protein
VRELSNSSSEMQQLFLVMSLRSRRVSIIANTGVVVPETAQV